MTTMLDHALFYRNMGLAVIPVRPRSKAAHVAWKRYQDAPPEVSQIRRWWTNKPDSGIACIAGRPSDSLVVRDFDRMDSYNCWAAGNALWAARLPTVKTARGRHVYCRGDIQQIRDASPSRSGSIHLGDGELRGEGSYTLLPPSVHPSGATYEWLRIPNEIPRVDLIVVGFLGKMDDVTQRDTENAENTEKHRRTQRNQEMRPRSLTRERGDSDFQKAVAKAIKLTIPERPGTRHRQVFQLCRALKGIPELADAEADNLLPYVKQWYKAALQYVTTKDFADTWCDFLDGWKRVRVPLGSDSVSMLFAKAISGPMPDVMSKYESPKLTVLTALCREMQRATTGESFYLGARTVARLLEIEPMTASRYLRLMVNDRVLEISGRGNLKGRRATCYRYLGPLD
jgi:hypothetical protein